MMKPMQVILSTFLLSLGQTYLFSMADIPGISITTSDSGIPGIPGVTEIPAPTDPGIAQAIPAMGATPDQTGAIPGATPAAPTPGQPPAPAGAPGGAGTADVQSQQFGPPDTIALSEEKIGLMVKNNPNLALLYNQGVDAVQKMAASVKTLQTQRDALVAKYNDLDKNMTDLWPIHGILTERFKGLSQSNAPEHAADLGQLSTLFQTISDKRAEILSLQSKFSQEISQAQTSMQDANTKKEMIFTQANDQGAQAIVTDINTTLQNVQNIQNTNQTQTAATFQAAIDQITQTITTLRTLINTLQQKGFALQVAKAEATVATKPITQAKQEKASFVSWLIPPPPKKGIPTGQAPTFVHYMFTRMADLLTDGIKIMYDTWEYLKNKTKYLWKKYITKEPMPPVVKALPVAAKAQVPTMPTQTPATMPQPPAMPTTSPPPAPMAPPSITPAPPPPLPAPAMPAPTPPPAMPGPATAPQPLMGA